MTVNNVLKHQDISHYEALAKNWEERRDMEEMSMQNVERWRQEVYAARTENIRALKTSKRLAQQLVEDSRRRASDVSVSSGSSFAGSSGYFWEQGDQDSMQRFLVAADTSTVVCEELPTLYEICTRFYMLCVV